MIYILLFAICLSICWLLAEYLPFKKMSRLKHFLEANNLFCIEYLLFSCCFLFFETFAVWKSLLCVLAFNIILLFALIIKKVPRKTWEDEKCSKQELILLLITLGMIVPFIYITTEDIAADTDQGAYFLHTCILMEEKSKEVHSLKEIGKISDAVDEGVRKLLNDLTCYYHEENEDVFYIFSLDSWCSYPALFGKIFGIWNSMKAVNWLYILIIYNLFYVCKKLVSPYNVYLYIVMFALSPLLLYIGKAGLSEIVTLYLVTLGLHYIFEEKIVFSVVSGMCIGLIGYVHISMYAYMPIITSIALLESTKKKKVTWFNITQLLMFSCSMWYAYKISPVYVKKQYLRFTMNGRIDYFMIFLLIDIVVAACILIQIYINKRQNKFFDKLRSIIYGNFTKISIGIWGIIFISTIYYAYFMCFTNRFSIEEGVDAGTWSLRNEYINKGISAISHLNIINISRAIGIIGMLIFAAIPVLNCELSQITKTFYFIALYGMVIWTVLQMDTPSNYYSSRYFVPVLIPMIVLTVVSAVKSKNWCIYFMMAVVLYNHRFWPAFLMGGPKVGQYELLQDTLEIIPENAIVFCNPESHAINARLSGNLRVLNDNEVYSLDNMDEVLNFYSDSDAYILSENELDSDEELIKAHIYSSQYSFGNGKNGTYDMGVGTYEIPLYIYKIRE